MPENKVMTIEGETFWLEKRNLSIKVNMAINIFFNILAIAGTFKTIAVVLSRMGNDEIKGAKAIAKSAGGVIVQEPVTSAETGMPDSLTTSGIANLVLAPRICQSLLSNW